MADVQPRLPKHGVIRGAGGLLWCEDCAFRTHEQAAAIEHAVSNQFLVNRNARAGKGLYGEPEVDVIVCQSGHILRTSTPGTDVWCDACKQSVKGRLIKRPAVIQR